MPIALRLKLAKKTAIAPNRAIFASWRPTMIALKVRGARKEGGVNGNYGTLTLTTVTPGPARSHIASKNEENTVGSN
jgi:hypothetical protein